VSATSSGEILSDWDAAVAAEPRLGEQRSMRSGTSPDQRDHWCEQVEFGAAVHWPETELLRWEWLAHVVSLCKIAPERCQQSVGLRVLYALSDYAHAQRVTEIDRGADDGSAFAIISGGKSFGQRDVYLQLAYRQIAQIGQGRETCPEVVDGDNEAETVQPFDHLLGFLAISHHVRFGDLDDQTIGPEMVSREQEADPIG
jgi:hypothetical protein